MFDRLGYYYVPRSPLNPHGTYAIVSVEDLAAEPASRHHLAEVSGFGDGAPARRKTPYQVHLFAAAPELAEASDPFVQVIDEGYSDLPDDTEVVIRIGQRGTDMTLTLADFRKLRLALAKAEGL